MSLPPSIFLLCSICAGLIIVQSNALLPVSQKTSGQVRDATNGRLPRQVTPYQYTIEIAPNIYTGEPPFAFDGSVEIFIRCEESANWLTLNIKDLTISNPSIIVDPDTPVAAPSPILLSWSNDSSADFLTLNFVNSMIVNATYIIKMSFSGTLRPPTERGIYYDYYTTSDGVTKYVVATQLESIFARQTFPCFDEPDLKATFSVTILRKEPNIALSNMNLIRTDTRSDGWLADVFAISPIMSTYQVCIIVGEFDYVEAEWQNVTTYPVRIYSRPDLIPTLGFAAKVAPLFSAWFERETGIPYGTPKLDHIALPSKTGAMENWGLITYGEYHLSINSETSAASGRQGSASVIAHELAHQWYGNLVTCKWWDDIWLNEGFASYFNYLPSETIGWPTGELQEADIRPFMNTDSLVTSDPIRKNITTVWQAPSSFSGSTYPKGAAMVRMLNGLLSPETLNKAFTKYLTKYSYSAATTDDLWTELTAQAAEDGIVNPDGSALDVKSVMDPWLNQMGYPLITVSRNADGTADVTTQRFLNPRYQTSETPSPYNYSWPVPITVVTSTDTNWNPRPTFWIPLGQQSTTISGLPTDLSQWFLVNANQMFFYRIDYDNVTRAAIVQQLLTDNTKIQTESRSQFIEDSFTLSRTLLIPDILAMETTRYLGNEFSYNPWRCALKHTQYAERILRQFGWVSNYYAYLSSLIAPVYNWIGWNFSESETTSAQYLRRDIINAACIYGNADCKEKALALYATYIANPNVNSIDPNLLPTVLCVGINEGSTGDWSTIFLQYQNRRYSQIREERYAYLYALACTPSTSLIDIYLNYIVRGEQIAVRDQNQALSYLVQNSAGLTAVFKYFDNSWLSVPSTISKFTHMQSIVSTFSKNIDSSTFNNFVGKYPPADQSQLDQYRRMDLIINQNIDWVATNEQSLSEWIQSQLPSVSKTTLRLAGSALPATPFFESMELDIVE